MTKVYPLEGLYPGPKEPQAIVSVMAVFIASWKNGPLREVLSPRDRSFVPSDQGLKTCIGITVGWVGTHHHSLLGRVQGQRAEGLLRLYHVLAVRALLWKRTF